MNGYLPDLQIDYGIESVVGYYYPDNKRNSDTSIKCMPEAEISQSSETLEEAFTLQSDARLVKSFVNDRLSRNGFGLIADAFNSIRRNNNV